MQKISFSDGISRGFVLGIIVNKLYTCKFSNCRSNSGVVNLYDENCFTDRNPKPIKTVMNLTTSIHCVKFNPTRYEIGLRFSVIFIYFPL